MQDAILRNHLNWLLSSISGIILNELGLIYIYIYIVERKNEADLPHPLTSPAIQLAYEFSTQSQPSPPPKKEKTCLIAKITKEKVISLICSKHSVVGCFSPFAGPSS